MAEKGFFFPLLYESSFPPVPLPCLCFVHLQCLLSILVCAFIKQANQRAVLMISYMKKEKAALGDSDLLITDCVQADGLGCCL